MRKFVAFIGTLVLPYILVSNSAVAFPKEGQTYASIHIGFGAHDIKKDVSDGTNTAHIKISHIDPLVDATLGYHLLDELRIAINPMYIDAQSKKGKKKTFTVGSSTFDTKTTAKKIGLFGNIYYDILTGTKVNPFIMGGFGVIKHQIKDTITLADGTSGQGKVSKSSLAYQVGTGLAFHFNSSVDIELGYRIAVDMNRKKKDGTKKNIINYTVDSAGLSVRADPGYTHFTTIGIRYTF